MAAEDNDAGWNLTFNWDIRPYSRLKDIIRCIYSPPFTTRGHNSNGRPINWRLRLKTEDGFTKISLCLLDELDQELDFRCILFYLVNDAIRKIGDGNWIASNERKLLLDATLKLPPHDQYYLASGEVLTLRLFISPKIISKFEFCDLCFAITDLIKEVDDFIWPVEKVSALQKDQVRTWAYKSNLSAVSSATLKLTLTGDRNFEVNVAYHDPSDLLSTIWNISLINCVGRTLRKVKNISATEIDHSFLKVSLPITKAELLKEDKIGELKNTIFLRFRCSKVFTGKILFDSRESKEECCSKSTTQKCFPGTLCEDMNNLYKDGSFSDFSFVVGCRKFPAHKAVLGTRSPVFIAMFASDMQEKNQTSKVLTDIDAETLNRLLLYIYTDSVNQLGFEDAGALYSAADKYELLSLRNMCSSFLKSNISVSNVTDTLILSDMHSDDTLKKFAQDFIFDNGNEILRSDSWKNFRKHHALLAAETAEYMFLKKN